MDLSKGGESIVPCCRAPWIVAALTAPAFTASCAPMEEPSTVSNPDAAIPFHRWASRLFSGWSRDLKIGAKGPSSQSPIIPVSLAPCLTLVSRLPLGSRAKLRQTHTRMLICGPKKKKMGYTCLWQHQSTCVDHRHADDKDFNLR